jgi:hypothetical protein
MINIPEDSNLREYYIPPPDVSLKAPNIKVRHTLHVLIRGQTKTSQAAPV